jgi:hypothetical protein
VIDLAEISLTNVIKADKGSQTSERVRSTVMNLQLLENVVKLLVGEALEEKVKLCFVLGALFKRKVLMSQPRWCPTTLIYRRPPRNRAVLLSWCR